MFGTLSANVSSWLGATQPDDSEDKEIEETTSDDTVVDKAPSSGPSGEVRTSLETSTNSSPKIERETPSPKSENVEESPSKESESSADEAISEQEADLQQQLDEVGAKAITTAKEWGSWLYDMSKTAGSELAKTAKVMKSTVEEKTILGEFNKEQTKFLSENQDKKRKTEVGVAPWVGYNEEEAMKKQILALSQDQRNFLRNPPAGVQFQFDYSGMFPIALAMLQEDPRLSEMRFKLVPKKVLESNFWRNYFYRVSLIKQSAQLTSLAKNTGSTSETSEPKSTESTRESTNEEEVPGARKRVESEEMAVGSPVENEFISDAFQPSELDEQAIREEMQQLGMDADKTDTDDIPAWERELQAELQEYEVVDDGNALDDADLEQEILEQLEQDDAAK